MSVNSWMADRAAAGLEAVGVPWPGGDATLLHDLANAWQQMADTLRADLRVREDAVDETLLTWSGPAAQAFHDHWTHQREQLYGGADSLDRVATQLHAYADEIEALLSEIIEIGLEIAEAIGIGAALTFVTAGISDAIAAGVAAVRITRAAELVAEFGAAGERAAALILRVEEVMTSLTELLRPLASLGKDFLAGTASNLGSSVATQALTGERVDVTGDARDAALGGLGGVGAGRFVGSTLETVGLAEKSLVNASVSGGAGSAVGATFTDYVDVRTGATEREDVHFVRDGALGLMTGGTSGAVTHGLTADPGTARHRAEGLADLGSGSEVAIEATVATSGSLASDSGDLVEDVRRPELTDPSDCLNEID